MTKQKFWNGMKAVGILWLVVGVVCGSAVLFSFDQRAGAIVVCSAALIFLSYIAFTIGRDI